MSEYQTVYVNRIRDFLFCGYSNFLSTLINDDALPLSGFAAQGFWLENAYRKLLPDQRYVGSSLTSIELIEPSELPQYLRFKSPESFANHMFRLWVDHVIKNRGKVRGKDVVWSYRKQWWKAAHEIKTACYNYYQYLIREGLPISGFNKDVAFVFRDRKYVTRFDEVRRRMVVSEKGKKQRMQKDVDADWLITLQLLAFCTLAHDIEPYRMKWGVDSETADTWGGNGTYIDRRVRYRYHDLLRGKTYETTRCDDDIEDMLKHINEIQSYIETGTFQPNHKNCRACGYNVLVDNTHVCSKRNTKVDVLKSIDMFGEDL